MDLAEVINTNGLQQDDYSQSGITFGSTGQLSIVGHDGGKSWNKYYILKCSKCSQDSDLFGEGYFRGQKGSIIKGRIPCGCSNNHQWSQEQYSVRCSRKAKELGYTFLGFVGEWKGYVTKIEMLCDKHGKWDSCIINNLINNGYGCPGCRTDTITKPEGVMIQSFIDSGAFHPDTEFYRSKRRNKSGRDVYWYVYCPECGEVGEATSGHLQRGSRPCFCSPNRQQECYINWLIDEHNTAVAIKFGIAIDSNRRAKSQNSRSVYTIRQHAVYTFQDIPSCKKAERACLQELECGIVLKRDMPDGYTETTWVYNLEKIIEIYERNGGIKK